MADNVSSDLSCNSSCIQALKETDAHNEDQCIHKNDHARADTVSDRPDPQRMSPMELGRHGEAAAAAFLRRNGCTILEQNWKCPAGEVDIIAQDEHAIRFIEVKTRLSEAKGFPAEAVTIQKRRRYEKIAELYLYEYRGDETAIVFDIISILVGEHRRAFLRHHRSAFCFDEVIR